MKKFFLFLKGDIFFLIIFALLLGMFIGVVFNSSFILPLRVKMHDFYTHINPDSKKDSKTLIIDRVTKDIPNLPQKDIFENPTQKEAGFIYLIKKFIKKEDVKPRSIHDVIIN